jgi:arylsulfatase A-like enzyme
MMKTSRRDFIKTLGYGLTSFSIMGTSQCIRRRNDKPNIIFILADDLGYGDLGCYGQKKIKTPNLDTLAIQGMRFTQHYAGSTVCAPSRCALLTGLHTGHCEIRGNKEVGPEGQYPISAKTITMSKLLQTAGYVTGVIGKWGLGAPGSEGVPNKQGFDYFFGYNCQREAHFFYPTHLWRNDKKITIKENENGRKTIYSHDLLTKDALRFIGKNKDRPFFLYLPYTIPHAELAVPDDSLIEYRDQFPEIPYPGKHYGAQDVPHAAYAAMVSRLDRDVGRILSLLQELKIDENTIVLFSSDNGPHEEGGNDPEFFNSNGPFRGIKRDLYEGGIRVPLIIRWPGYIKPGKVSNHISAFWDFIPTLCDIAGISPPKEIDGISILPELLGQEQAIHDYLYWEFHERGGKQAVRMGDWKGVRLDVHENPDGPIELYNLSNDVAEEKNLALQNPEISEKIGQLMQQAHIESEIFPFYIE